MKKANVFKPFFKKGFPKKKSLKDSSQEFVLTPEYRTTVSQIAYLGKRGYTILKTALDPKDYEFLKKDLYVKANPGPCIGPKVETVAFPVFRESPNKLYIPRFYGIQRYGLPSRSEISLGETIDTRFVSGLRDYQTDIVQQYLDHVQKPMVNGTSCKDSLQELVCGGGGILEVACGKGKTVMAINIISCLKKKALILVHKEFLMNQWIERIAEFMPSARVGKIQGPKCEIEGNDIVIGMIQTMYSRDFADGTFDAFGITVIDEVHRIGSEEFSKTLLKICTPFMLGISATVDRKDGLTTVLNMFIGPKIYCDDSVKEDPVIVRGIQFYSADPEFSEVEYDFRGSPKYSTMISKLCDFGPRKDFIVQILGNLRLENGGKQIMVLAHNRALLMYLHDAIVYKGFGTCGYYIGGMKELALKETETKDIVLATYAMAAEALDIKSLSTLVMATPKTDIEQSVGRILRSRHENPIVVDIVDQHDLFQNQWRTRKTFYRKCNYKVVSTISSKYLKEPTDAGIWRVEYEPKVAKMVEPVTSGKPNVFNSGTCFIQGLNLEEDES